MTASYYGSAKFKASRARTRNGAIGAIPKKHVNVCVIIARANGSKIGATLQVTNRSAAGAPRRFYFTTTSSERARWRRYQSESLGGAQRAQDHQRREAMSDYRCHICGREYTLADRNARKITMAALIRSGVTEAVPVHRDCLDGHLLKMRAAAPSPLEMHRRAQDTEREIAAKEPKP